MHPVVAHYLKALEAWGYHLSPVERLAAAEDTWQRHKRDDKNPLRVL